MTKSHRHIFSQDRSSSISSLVKHLFKQIRHGDIKCSSEFGQCGGRDFFVGITEDISHRRGMIHQQVTRAFPVLILSLTIHLVGSALSLLGKDGGRIGHLVPLYVMVVR